MNAEQTREAAKVMLAVADGAKWQSRVAGIECGWVTPRVEAIPTWDWSTFDFRITPTPKLIPWTLETVPNGLLWVRQAGSSGYRAMVGKLDTDGVRLFTGQEFSYAHLCQFNEWLRPDGTWGPCGTEVVE